METDQVFIVDILDDIKLHEAIRLDANCIICNEIISTKEIPNEIKLINAELYRVQGTWLAYNYNTNVVSKLLSKIGKSFCIDTIRLDKSILKLVYWTNYKIGALQYAKSKLGPISKIVQDVQYFQGNKTKEIVKYLKFLTFHYYKRVFNKKSIKPKELLGKIGVLLNNEFELKLYSKILLSLNHSETIIFHYGNIEFNKFQVFSEIKKCDLSKIQNYARHKFANPFILNQEELSILNLVCNQWQNFSNEIAAYKYINNTGISKLLVNVAENLPVRNLMKEVFNENLLVYNTMNGLKSGEAHDKDVYFDKWFVWDIKMKEMMIQKCGLSENLLIVSGHLSEDFISEAKNTNSLKISDEIIKNKIVISIFSVRGKRQEKKDAFEVLYKFLKDNNDYFLIVKPHPLESINDYIFPPFELENMVFVEEKLKNSKIALYDQLLISDISIVFGSTVALESKWLGVPCLSIEYRDESFIYDIDNDEIKHIQSSKKLNEELIKTQKIKTRKSKFRSNVSSTIASKLIN